VCSSVALSLNFASSPLWEELQQIMIGAEQLSLGFLHFLITRKQSKSMEFSLNICPGTKHSELWN
jgi:hypothetical protein